MPSHIPLPCFGGRRAVKDGGTRRGPTHSLREATHTGQWYKMSGVLSDAAGAVRGKSTPPEVLVVDESLFVNTLLAIVLLVAIAWQLVVLVYRQGRKLIHPVGLS
eukprot:Sspe_Gene.80834::Locus_51290_Transcript_1_3_Confidence_0.400_Length_574::g.80834::m.80834